jgi:hypothetical protein
MTPAAIAAELQAAVLDGLALFEGAVEGETMRRRRPGGCWR